MMVIIHTENRQADRKARCVCVFIWYSRVH